jgi:high-affinity K+ transport system ATPase subunit B
VLAVIAVNFVIVTILEIFERVVGFRQESIPFVLLLFFLFLLSLLVVLFDRFHMVYAERRRRARAGGDEARAQMSEPPLEAGA